MSSSAINSQIWNAKAANVQNADGSPIYSAGIWTFKSSTAVTTFTVSDAGVVIVASYLQAANQLEAKGAALVAEANKSVFGYATSRVRIIGYGPNASTGCGITISGRRSDGTSDVTLADCDSTGAWTLGPATTYNAPFVTYVNASGAKLTKFIGGVPVSLSAGSAIAYNAGSVNNIGALVLMSYVDIAGAGTVLALVGYNSAVAIVSQVGAGRGVVGAPAANQFGLTYASGTGVLTVTSHATFPTNFSLTLMAMANFA